MSQAITQRKSDKEKYSRGLPDTDHVKDPNVKRCLDAIYENIKWMTEGLEALQGRPSPDIAALGSSAANAASQSVERNLKSLWAKSNTAELDIKKIADQLQATVAKVGVSVVSVELNLTTHALTYTLSNGTVMTIDTTVKGVVP